MRSTIQDAHTADVGLTADMFLHHMTNMQGHYTPGGAGLHRLAKPYVLPVHIVQTTVPNNGAVAKALHTAEQDTLQFVNGHHAGIVTALAQTKADSNTSRFVAQMQALEQQSLADHAARIHKLFAALIAAGHANPGQQAHILVTGNTVGGFLAGLLRDAHAATQGIAGLFTGASHGVGAAVQGATQAAGHWVSGAVSSVGSFFRSLF